jgi:PAS domain S-box-containing protein
MKGIFRSIQEKFLHLTVIAALLFILIMVLQYNNLFYTQKTINYDNLVNQTYLVPNKITILHNQFCQKDLVNDKFYTSEKSMSLDSLNFELNLYKTELDSINKCNYLTTRAKTRTKITSLKADCDKLIAKYARLKQAILDRGFYTTGKSGEWQRFSAYFEDLANSFNNITLSKSIINIIKTQNQYQLVKTNDQMQSLIEQINALAISLNVKDGACTVGLTEADKLKLIKELETFAALSSEIQKIDIRIGLSGGAGMFGDVDLLNGIIHDKSIDVYNEIRANISQEIFASFVQRFLLILALAVFYLIFISRFSSKLYLGINDIKEFSSTLVLGKLPSAIKLATKSELADIADILNNFVSSLREKIRYASQLASGQTDSTLVPLSEYDTLANALLDVEKSLKKADEEDNKYKIEEKKRTWTNEGLAKFGEILRMQTDNLANLSDEIIINLVKYLNADLGGIFLYNDEDKNDIYLEMISAFAFDRKKFIKKRIALGEGLVGTCAQEKQTIFVTDIPENYVEITSGLGSAPPRCILIVPLKTEENIFGILELASFNIFQPFEIDFVEKLSQSIATTYATVKININTNRLLEQSKKQAEEMSQQEEEMRQNLEELQATQEEAARREAEINSLANAVDASALVIQTDMEGRVIEVNKKFASIIKMHRDELIGKYLKNTFIFNTEADEFYNLLHELKSGKVITRDELIQPDENHKVYLEMHYSPILGHDGKPYKVLGIATNITEHKLLEQTLKSKEEELIQLDATFDNFKEIIKQGFIVCELAPDLTIAEVNDYYAEITGYHVDELVGKDYRKFLRPDELKQFEVIWSEVLKDKDYKGVIKRTKPTGDENWLMTSIIPLKDNKGTIKRIYLLAHDITEKKLKYQVLEEANKEIERLKGLQNQSS